MTSSPIPQYLQLGDNAREGRIRHNLDEACRLAKEGDTAALSAIVANVSILEPDALRTAYGIFFHTLHQQKGRWTARADSDADYQACTIVALCIAGIQHYTLTKSCSRQDLSRRIGQAWPFVAECMRYVNEYTCLSYGDSDEEVARRLAIMSIHADFLCILFHCGKSTAEVGASDMIVDLVLSFWLHPYASLDEQEFASHALSILLAVLDKTASHDMHWKTIMDSSKRCGASADDVAELVLARLESAAQRVSYARWKGPQTLHRLLVALSKPFDVLSDLIRVPPAGVDQWYEDRPFHDALARRHGVKVVLRTLRVLLGVLEVAREHGNLSLNDQKTLVGSMLAMGLCICYHAIQSIIGFRFLRQTLRYGIISTCLQVGHWIEHLGDEGTLKPTLACVLSTIPKYFVLHSNIVAARRSFKVYPISFESKDFQDKVRASGLEVEWSNLVSMYLHGAAMVKRLRQERDAETVCCENFECSSRGPRRDFYRCAGCMEVAYCSPECQERDWKNFHRDNCTRLGGNDPSGYITLRDNRLIIRTTREDVVRLANASLRDRKLQKKLYGVPLKERGLVLDYTPVSDKGGVGLGHIYFAQYAVDAKHDLAGGFYSYPLPPISPTDCPVCTSSPRQHDLGFGSAPIPNKFFGRCFTNADHFVTIPLEVRYPHGATDGVMQLHITLSRAAIESNVCTCSGKLDTLEKYVSVTDETQRIW